MYYAWLISNGNEMKAVELCDSAHWAAINYAKSPAARRQGIHQITVECLVADGDPREELGGISQSFRPDGRTSRFRVDPQQQTAVRA